MSITRSRVIDQKAQKIFVNKIPDTWLIREQHPDIYVDYFIEIGKETKLPSGILCGIQLKGTESPKYAKDTIKLQFATKPLIYYRDNFRLPLFIMHVDVNLEKCYFLFIQKWLIENQTDDRWRSQKKITLRFNLSDNLDDSPSIYSKVVEAEKYMRNLWPGTISAATEYEKNKLKSLDQRFDIDISQSNKNINYNLIPRENVPLLFSFKNTKENEEAFRALFDYGDDCILRGEDLRIKGSKLFDEIFNRSVGGEFQIGTHKNIVFIELSILAEDSSVISFLSGIKGPLSGGRKGIKIDARHQNSPLKVSVFFDGLKFYSGLIFRSSVEFDESIWINHKVQTLPYFDDLYRFFKELKKGRKVQIRCTYQGNQLFNGLTEGDEINNYLKSIHNYLEAISKLRKIQSYFNSDIFLPSSSNITIEDYNNINVVHSLVQNKQYTTSGRSLSLSTKIIPNSNFDTKLDEFKNKDYSIRIVTDYQFSIFSREYNFSSLECIYENAEILTQAPRSKDQKEIAIKIVGKPNSTLRMNLLSE